jgi:hypothetical protein
MPDLKDYSTAERPERSKAPQPRRQRNEYRFAMRRPNDINRPLGKPLHRTIAALPALLVDIGDSRTSRSFPNPKIW